MGGSQSVSGRCYPQWRPCALGVCFLKISKTETNLRSYPYSKLKAPNVQGTIDALKLCAIGRAKSFVFVSSTSVLDNDHYVQLSDNLSMQGKLGIPESDNLDGSSTGLSKLFILLLPQLM